MNNRTLLPAVLAAIILTSSGAFALTETVNGIRWTYTVTDGKASVGGGSASSTAVPKSTSGAITIPSSLGGYPVTAIRDYAFNGRSGLTSVTIPDSVASIGNRAFADCSGLLSMKIPDGVTSIGYGVFSGCSGLTSVTLPNALTSISPTFFESCSSLMSITIPGSVTSIGNVAFYGCTSLMGIEVPNSVTNIGELAFYYCRSLSFVDIGTNVATIGEAAFCDCGSGITAVAIPSGVKSIGSAAFAGNTALEAITVSELNEFYVSHDGVLFSKDMTTLVFCPPAKQGSYSIPNNVTAIDAYAFSLSMLTAVVVPDGVSSSGERAFRNCENLESIVIPSGVTSIEYATFYCCVGLKSIVVPDSLTNIDGMAFRGCDNLGSIVYVANAPSSDYFSQFPENAILFVDKRSTGWDVDIPGVWNERRIDYLPSSIEIQGESSVHSGGTTSCICVATYSDGSSRTVEPDWAISSADAFGEVSDSGVFYAGATAMARNATIVASYGGKTATKIISITPEVPLALSISGPGSIGHGQFAQFNCEATLSNGTSEIVPSIWSLISGSSYGSISDNGLFTAGNDVGTIQYVSLQASFNDIKAEKTICLVDVLPVTENITTSANWGCSVYHVSGNITIFPGATLTIAPGAVVKFASGYSLTVSSGATLDARGSRSEPIIFTSIKDDEHGGDTNGDRDATYAQPGDWHQITGSGTVMMEYCQVLWCSAQNNQGALYPKGGTWTFDNSIVAHCKYDCMRSYGGTFTAKNSIFMDSSMGAAPSSGTARFVNCIFHDLTTAVRWGNGTFNNCIFSAVTKDILDPSMSGAASQFHNCCFWSPEATGDKASSKIGHDGNIWGDPLFLDPDNGDFRIFESSPCVDAADSSVAPELDYFGQPRKTVRPAPTGTPDALGRRADIGLHEYYPTNAPGPYDLEAEAVSASTASAAPGGTLAVSWTVRNTGKRMVPDAWHDALALVSVATGKAYTLGEPLSPGALAVGALRESSAQFAVPVVSSGDYRLRLSVNSRRSDVAEGSSTANNAILSDSIVSIALAATPASSGATGTVAPGAASVTAFSIPVGSGDLLLRVAAPMGGIALKGRCGLDFLPVDGGSGSSLVFADGEAWLSVPAGTETVYLVLENSSAVAVAFTADFRAGSLAVASVSPTTLPASGTVTLDITGAGFTDGCAVTLGGPASVPATAVRCVSASLLVATFDCAALTAGATYDLAVAGGSPSPATASLPNAVSVAAAPGEGKFWARLSIPESVREGRLVSTCFIEYGNSGTADVLSPVLQVSMDGNGTLGYIGGLSGQKTLQFVAAGDEGSAGVLRPGATRRVRFALRAGSRNSISLHPSVGSDYAPAPWTTAADYHADLSAAATRIGLRGQDPTDYALVFDLAAAMKRGEPTSAIFGRVIDEDGAGVEGVGVTVENVSGVRADAVSDAHGHFCTTNLAAGAFSVRTTNARVLHEFEKVNVDGSADYPLGEITVDASVNFKVAIVGGDEVVAVIARNTKGCDIVAIASMDGSGNAVFAGLEEGLYIVQGLDSNGVIRSTTVMVSAGKAEDASLDFNVNCTLRIKAVGLENPEECLAAIFCNGDLERTATFDSEGEIFAESLPSGDCLVVIGRRNSEDTIGATTTLTNKDSGEIEIDATGRLAISALSASVNATLSSRTIRLAAGSGLSNLYPTGSLENNCQILLDEANAMLATPVLPPQGIYNCEHNQHAYLKTCEYFKEHRSAQLRFFAVLSQYRAANARKWAQVWLLGPMTAEMIAGAYFGPIGGVVTSLFDKLLKGYVDGDIDPAEGEDLIADCGLGMVEILQKEGIYLEGWGTLGAAVGNLKTIVSSVLQFGNIGRGWKSELDAETVLEEEYKKFYMKMFAFNFHYLRYDGVNGNYFHQCDEYTITETLPTIEAISPFVPQSCDPNEMKGPEGLGADRALLPGETYEWTVYFENTTNATAAASEVRVTAQLSDQLDWSTFQTLSVSFGDETDVGLLGQANGTSDYLVPGTNYTVHSEVQCDAATGAVSWYLRIVDPDGDEEGYPLDPTAGFLPPNDPATHCGEGSITYRVTVRGNATAGAIIPAAADIKFDGNPIIPTDPAWTNTVATVYKPVVDLGDGTTANVMLVVGQPYGALPTPKAKAGYTFGGWFTGPNGTGTKITPETIVQKGANGIYPHWIKNPSPQPAITTYKVAFNANGGKGKMAAQTFTCGKAAKLRKNAFTRNGYVFIGWAKSKKGAAAYRDAQGVKNLAAAGKTVTLYAQWAKKTYKVSFYANGGKGKMAAQAMTYGKAKKLGKNKFTRTGYAFKGWATSKALAKKGKVAYKNGKSVKNLVTTGKTVKLYAVWKKK